MACRMPRSSASVASTASRASASELQRASRSLPRRTARQAAAALGGRRRQGLARHRLDRRDRVDVGAAQLEHALHAGVRGDAGQLRLHALEHRPVGLGAQVADVQAMERGGGRVQHQHRGVRVGQDVLPRLVEELERERHVAFVHVEHLRDVGDVGHAVGAAGGQHGGDRAFQAGPDVRQRRPPAHACASQPATGPGPGRLVERLLRREAHGHHVVQPVREHGARHLRRIAGQADLPFHGRQVAGQQRPVRLLRRADVRAGGLELHAAVRGRLAEDHGQVAGAGDVLQQLARLRARQEHRDVAAVRRDVAAEAAHDAGAQAASREPTITDTPRAMKASMSGGSRSSGLALTGTSGGSGPARARRTRRHRPAAPGHGAAGWPASGR